MSQEHRAHGNMQGTQILLSQTHMSLALPILHVAKVWLYTPPPPPPVTPPAAVNM